MARLPRFVLPGQPQHVIQRGNNRQAIFCAQRDYHFYLEKLYEAAEKHQCVIHAYVLMTNHVHLLVTPHSGEGIGKMMQMLGRYYVQCFNYCSKRTGTLWEGRYKAPVIDTEQYLFTCMRLSNSTRSEHKGWRSIPLSTRGQVPDVMHWERPTGFARTVSIQLVCRAGDRTQVHSAQQT